MAKVDIKMPDAFLERMSHLGSNFDAVAESVLEAGGEVVLQKVQVSLASVIASGTKYDSRSTGELEANNSGGCLLFSVLFSWSENQKLP